MNDYALCFVRRVASGAVAAFNTMTGAASTYFSQVDVAAVGSSGTGAIRYRAAVGMGDGKPVRVVVQLLNSLTADGTLTSLTAKLRVAPDNGSGAPGTFVDVVTGPTVAKAGCTAGARLLDVALPRGIVGEWYEIAYTNVGALAGTANLAAWLDVD